MLPRENKSGNIAGWRVFPSDSAMIRGEVLNGADSEGAAN